VLQRIFLWKRIFARQKCVLIERRINKLVSKAYVEFVTCRYHGNKKKSLNKKNKKKSLKLHFISKQLAWKISNFAFS